MYNLISYDSLSQFRAIATQWDDLWRRSTSSLPTARAEPLRLWFEQFARGAKLRLLAVADGDDLVAALPLYGGPATSRLAALGRWAAVGRLPVNVWDHCGDLLIDPQADEAAVVARLVDGIDRLPWPLLWLEGMNLALPRWRTFVAALEASRRAHCEHALYCVGQVEIAHDWEAYERSRSRNHRQQTRKGWRHLERAGGQWRFVQQPLGSDVDSLLRRGFEVEDRSWKGQGGSSVLRATGLLEYFCRQAAALAAAGQLDLSYVELEGVPIGFIYGWRGKDTYYTPKIGYDEQHAGLSPGRLLMGQLIHRLHDDRSCRTLDFFGPLVESTARWATASYDVSRLLVATGMAGRALLGSYHALRPRLLALRGRRPVDEPPSVRPLAAPSDAPDSLPPSAAVGAATGSSTGPE